MVAGEEDRERGGCVCDTLPILILFMVFSRAVPFSMLGFAS